MGFTRVILKFLGNWVPDTLGFFLELVPGISFFIVYLLVIFILYFSSS